MREAMFIKKNAEKWKSYQQQEAKDPDEAAERFITLMDDLAYAKTFYPKSKVTRWINGLASTTYQHVYRNRREKYSRIFSFWKYELPLVIRRHHATFLFTALLFTLFTCIGVFSSIHNPEFVRGILGDDYVNRTERNIRNGNPFGVYSQGNYFNMFVRIAFNNISVAFKTFAGGFTAGIITVLILWQNGVMLGSFQHMFFANNLGMESILVVWIHGTIEISSIVISGAAGFILANGFLFPGTYSRIESFKRNGKDAAKILICLIPFFIIAAFLESYITHLMGATYAGQNGGIPEEVSILILILSVSLIVFYFIIWPIVLSRRGYVLQKGGVITRTQTGHA